MTNDEALATLDESLRRLQVQYHLFFFGVRKLPPTEDRKRLDTLVREIEKRRIRDNGSRFRLVSLVSKYNQFQELWSRQMREREEGPVEYQRRMAAFEAAGGESSPGGGGSSGGNAGEQDPERRETSGGADSYVRVSPRSNGDAMKALHTQIEAANQALGKASMTFDQVSSMIEKQADALRIRFGVDTVAFKVETVDGKLKLKAKPVQAR